MVFTLRPAAHLPWLVTLAGFGTMSGSSAIVRFVQGGVVKTFRCRSLIRLENYDPCVGANSYVAIGLLPAKAVRVLAALQAVPTTLQTSHADQ